MALNMTDLGLGEIPTPENRPKTRISPHGGNWRSVLSSLVMQTEANLATPSYEFGRMNAMNANTYGPSSMHLHGDSIGPGVQNRGANTMMMDHNFQNIANGPYQTQPYSTLPERYYASEVKPAPTMTQSVNAVRNPVDQGRSVRVIDDDIDHFKMVSVESNGERAPPPTTATVSQPQPTLPPQIHSSRSSNYSRSVKSTSEADFDRETETAEIETGRGNINIDHKHHQNQSQMLNESRIMAIESQLSHLERSETRHLQTELLEMRHDVKGIAEKGVANSLAITGTVESLSRVETRIRRLKKKMRKMRRESAEEKLRLESEFMEKVKQLDGDESGGEEKSATENIQESRIAFLEKQVAELETTVHENIEEKEAQSKAMEHMNKRISDLAEDMNQLQSSISTVHMVLKDVVTELAERE